MFLTWPEEETRSKLDSAHAPTKWRPAHVPTKWKRPEMSLLTVAWHHYALPAWSGPRWTGPRGGCRRWPGWRRTLTSDSQQEDGADQFLVRLGEIICTFSDFDNLDQLFPLKVRYRLSRFLFFAAKLCCRNRMGQNTLVTFVLQSFMQNNLRNTMYQFSILTTAKRRSVRYAGNNFLPKLI